MIERQIILPSPKKIYFSVAVAVFIVTVIFSYGLKPASQNGTISLFSISPGDSFKEIIDQLKAKQLIRSAAITKIFAVVTGSAHKLKPGLYELSPNLSSAEIVRELVRGENEVEIIVREGLSVFEVDRLLGDAKVISPGDLISFNSREPIEGKLFPDTYKFFPRSPVNDVVKNFRNNFDRHLSALLSQDQKNMNRNLILASLIEEEVPNFEDQKVVAGILKKRLKAGFPLQVDATICYAKLIENLGGKKCYPLTSLDMKINSPYNTYQYKGLPPGPIVSPGVSAVQAVLEARETPYWFYLSDQRTRNTIFSKTLEEHNQNIAKYLKT